MKEAHRILMIEENMDDFKLVLEVLKKENWHPFIHRIQTREEMIEALKESWDLILSDYSLPQLSGLEALELLSQSKLDIPFIIVSGTIGEETAVEIMRAGASDYILKDHLPRLFPAIQREIEAGRARNARRNVTQALKDTEDQLRHIQKMDAIGQLAGGVAHDFNNLLALMQIYIQKIKDEKISSIESFTEKLEDARIKATSLTKQLLLLSRRQPASISNLSLNEIVLEMKEMLESSLGKSIRLVVNPSKDSTSVRVDRVHMDQILLNLILNAKEAMSNGGKIILRTQAISFVRPYRTTTREIPQGRYIIIEVTDQGSGIPAEIIQRIFDPFFTTKTAGHGAGLGLSVVYGIVHQYQGGISVFSTPGKGSQIQIFIPENSAQPSVVVPPQPSAPTKEKSDRETLLLVDDNPELRALYSEILNNQGYQVLNASDGESAIEIIRGQKDKIDLVITDMMMPKVSGQDLHRWVIEQQADMKFLYVSGYFADTFLTTNQSGHDFFYLEKPFSERMLLERVRSILDS